MRIEAKTEFKPSEIQSRFNFLSLKDVINTTYILFSKDEYQLKYKVQKLSKKARRNTSITI